MRLAVAGVVAIWAQVGVVAAPLELDAVRVSHAVAVVGEPVEVVADVRNVTGQQLDRVVANLFLPPGWSAEPVQIVLPAIAPYTTHRLRFRLVAGQDGHGAGRLVLEAPPYDPELAFFPLASCQPLQVLPALRQMQREHLSSEPGGDVIYITTGHEISYIVFLPPCGGDRGPGLIYMREGATWTRVATFPALGRVIYRDRGADGAPVVAEHWVFAKQVWLPRDPNNVEERILTLKDWWTDGAGRKWMAKAWFAWTADSRVVKCTHAVMCWGDAEILRYEGPQLCVGDGTFGAANAGLLLPPEAPVAEELLVRTGASSEGYAAVARPGGGLIGLLWDPQQLWTAGQAQPHLLAAAPNRLYGRANTYLSLLAPHFGPAQTADEVWAEPALKQPARRPIFLRTELYVDPAGELARVREVWRERFGRGPTQAFVGDRELLTDPK